MEIDMLLARYLDGDMDEAERAEFESRLDREPELADRLGDWREQDQLVAQDLASLLAATPAPEMLVPSANPPIDLAARRQEKARAAAAKPVQQRRWAMPAALAASLAVVGLFTVPLLRESQVGPLDALDELPAGQSATLADGSQLTAVLTFASADGRWCREYTIDAGATGIACRDGNGWASQGAIAGAGSNAADAQQGYITASGASSETLDAIYAELGASDPLSAEDEAKLIEKGWTSPAG